MNNLTFYDDLSKKTYRRVQRATAKKLYIDGKTILLCPSNLRPFNNRWHSEIDINKNDYLKRGYTETNHNYSFDHRVNSFEGFVCINNETGRRVNYYVAID